MFTCNGMCANVRVTLRESYLASTMLVLKTELSDDAWQSNITLHSHSHVRAAPCLASIWHCWSSVYLFSCFSHHNYECGWIQFSMKSNIKYILLASF